MSTVQAHQRGFQAAMLDWRAWLTWLARLPLEVARASGYWALVVLVFAWRDPALVLPDAAGRLRWVLLAGLLTALLRDPPLGWWVLSPASAESTPLSDRTDRGSPP